MASPEIINVSDDSIDSTISMRNSEIENEMNPLMQSYCGVPAGSRGEGLPYAPQGWPNPEDKWGWQVGKRTNLNGSWRDRYLILPKSLSKGRRAIRFQSKLEVIKYLTETFPGLDLEKFFASFQWLVPAYFPDQMPTKSNNEEEVASGNPNFSNTIAVDREKKRIIPDLRCLPADRRALTVEKEVNQALHMLRRSQEREYIAARDKLLAQKDLLVTFLQPTNGSLSSSALEKAYEKELERFRNMLVIAKGFGNTSREFLQHHFPKGSDGYQPDAYSEQVIRLGWIDRKSEFPNPNEEEHLGEPNCIVPHQPNFFADQNGDSMASLLQHINGAAAGDLLSGNSFHQKLSYQATMNWTNRGDSVWNPSIACGTSMTHHTVDMGQGDP